MVELKLDLVALGVGIELWVDDARFAQRIGLLFAPFNRSTTCGDKAAASNAVRHQVRVGGEPGGPRKPDGPHGVDELVVVEADGDTNRFPFADVVTHVVHAVNRMAIDNTPLVALHAGAVARNGRAIILVAKPESGKTTLTTALVRDGCDYLSDEVAGFDWGDTVVHPYPKPLSLDLGSWPLFPGLRSAGEADGVTGQWQISPQQVRSGSVAGPAPLHTIIFPTYRPGVASELLPIGPAEALVELARNTFSYNAQPRRVLDHVAKLVGQARCYRLTVSDLGEAVRRLSDCLDSPT